MLLHTGQDGLPDSDPSCSTFPSCLVAPAAWSTASSSNCLAQPPSSSIAQLGGGGSKPRPTPRLLNTHSASSSTPLQPQLVKPLSSQEYTGLPQSAQKCVQQYYRLKSLFSRECGHLTRRSQRRKLGQVTLDGFLRSTLHQLEAYPHARGRILAFELQTIAADPAIGVPLGITQPSASGLDLGSTVTQLVQPVSSCTQSSPVDASIHTQLSEPLELATTAWKSARDRLLAVTAHTKANVLHMTGI